MVVHSPQNLYQLLYYFGQNIKCNRFHIICTECTEFRQRCNRKLRVGKADFKSASKTLSAAGEKQWLCYSLAYNPELQRFQVIRLYTQAFGSLGGVVAWYRTAKLIQTIMLDLFHIVVFAYVDDFFWVVPDGCNGESMADFVLRVF